MVTLEQIKQGAARYVDEEFTGKLTGWQKWAVGAGAAMPLAIWTPAFPPSGSTPP